MTTLETCKKISTEHENLESKALATIKALVNERGGRIEFDWENDDAPSIDSKSFKGDVADCYIKALYMEDETLHADLHAYYLGDDNSGVNLVDDESICWCSLLGDLIPYLTFQTEKMQ